MQSLQEPWSPLPGYNSLIPKARVRRVQWWERPCRERRSIDPYIHLEGWIHSSYGGCIVIWCPIRHWGCCTLQLAGINPHGESEWPLVLLSLIRLKLHSMCLCKWMAIRRKNKLCLKSSHFKPEPENSAHNFSGLSSKETYSSRSMRFCLPFQSEARATFSSSCNLENLSVRDLKRDFWTLISPSLR